DVVRSVIRDKQDYGVFGVPSSPNLTLAENDERRRPGIDFSTEDGGVVAKRADGSDRERRKAEKKRRWELREKPRLVSNLDVRFVSEPADFDMTARGPAANEQVYEADAGRAEFVRDESAAPQGASSLSTVRREPHAAESVKPVAAPVIKPEVGVIVMCGEGDALGCIEAAGQGSAMVVVAGAGDCEALRDAGIDVVEVDGAGFSGGRARNAGYRRLKKIAPQVQFVQFVQAGERLDPEWFAYAANLMIRRPEVAALEGVVEFEMTGEESIFNRALGSHGLGDGEIQTTGPTAMFRTDAFEAAGGFRGDIIADETADLCIRLRRRGAHIWRSDEVMARCDEKRLNFQEWRALVRRAGYSYAAGAALHGGSPEKFCATEQARAVMWGAVFPSLVLISAVIGGAAVALLSIGVNPFVTALSIAAAGLLIYCLKIAASAAKAGILSPQSWSIGAVRTLGHFYECSGVARYWFGSKKSAQARKPIA
ncbi:MAG: hypothetical protein KDE05_00330, partial [Parvularculaceae bacterium]|nr:hypothetical protein [Parvularculaceae bacterium]